MSRSRDGDDTPKVVRCPAGHPVGRIVDGRMVMDGSGPLRSTDKGFIPSCPTCGVALREWTVPWWQPFFKLVRSLGDRVDHRTGEVKDRIEKLEGIVLAYFIE